jgi:hypothetical protein
MDVQRPLERRCTLTSESRISLRSEWPGHIGWTLLWGVYDCGLGISTVCFRASPFPRSNVRFAASVLHNKAYKRLD